MESDIRKRQGRRCSDAGIEYAGYLANLGAPEVYARSRLALHVPRRQYANGLSGVPTIRVFEVLACGIPLVCAPWADTEELFRAGQDYLLARNGAEMRRMLGELLENEEHAPANCIEWTGNHPAASYLQASGRAADGDLRRNQAMRIFVFGSSITSSYWNGAATYYRGIYKGLAALGHEITFAEPDIFNRQQNRDLSEVEYAKVIVYQTPRDIDDLIDLASTADLVIKHSGVGSDDELLERRVLDCRDHRRHTRRLHSGTWMRPRHCNEWKAIPCDPFRRCIPQYDFVFTYGGGPEVVRRYRELGARNCHPIYNALDPETHHPEAA